jgi:predicted ATP-binding protein involved in virulence
LYLKRVSIQNMGPIDNLELELPFKNDLPMPVCFVGANGSGKSTVLSTIVNGMVISKGVAFDDAEIEKGKFFRLGNQQFIKYGEHYYHTLVEFSDGILLEGWMLDRPREKFESELEFFPEITSWSQIPKSEDHYFTIPSEVNLAKIRNAFAGNCVLYFPPNRFEEPSWLNEDNLLGNVKFEQRRNIRNLSERLIFSQSRVAATCDWLLNVVLDKLVVAREGKSQIIPEQQQLDDPNDRILTAITSILKLVLADEQSEVSLSIGNRQNRQLGIVVNSSDGTAKTIPNVFALSSGESSLFALFSSILFDFDRSGVEFTSLQEVKGIVVIDEIDTHLHLDLQRKILPKLLKLFEGVQFIITTHSPLFLLGLRDTFGSESVQVISLPDGNSIDAEDFSEFDSAYIAMQNTARYRRVEQEVIKSRRPLLIVEGRSDEIILNTAWQKLSSAPIPFDIKAAGIHADSTKRSGGADSVRRTIEFLATVSERTIIGLFDNDREGNDKFKGLHKDAFEDWSANCDIRKHRTAKVWGLLLPVVVSRKNFVTADINHRYLVIEHYFSDDLLSSFHMKKDGILGTEVFEVSDQNKVMFAEKCSDFDNAEFEGFRMLFSRLADISNEYSPQSSAIQSMTSRLDLGLLDV